MAVRALAARAYFGLCRALGSLLRAGRYSTASVVEEGGARRVRKHRRDYAPLLVWMGGLLVRLLHTGVRVLPQREWEAQERRIYQSLHGIAIRVDADGTLILPCLPGETLASLLDDRALAATARTNAITCAVVALSEFHRRGFTHGDAMAENVLVDLGAGVAHWFDFETAHDPRRPDAWRRADDVRALLATCLLRTGPEQVAVTIDLIVGVYHDEAVTRRLSTSFGSVFQRPLAFHLAQAGLSFRRFEQIGRLLNARGE